MIHRTSNAAALALALAATVAGCSSTTAQRRRAVQWRVALLRGDRGAEATVVRAVGSDQVDGEVRVHYIESLAAAGSERTRALLAMVAEGDRGATAEAAAAAAPRVAERPAAPEGEEPAWLAAARADHLAARADRAFAAPTARERVEAMEELVAFAHPRLPEVVAAMYRTGGPEDDLGPLPARYTALDLLKRWTAAGGAGSDAALASLALASDPSWFAGSVAHVAEPFATVLREETDDVLLERLGAAEPAERAGAAILLAHRGRVEGRMPAFEIYRAAEPHAPVRLRIATLLAAATPVAELAPFTGAWLADPDPDVRRIAVTALGARAVVGGDTFAASELLAALATESDEDVLAAGLLAILPALHAGDIPLDRAAIADAIGAGLLRLPRDARAGVLAPLADGAIATEALPALRAPAIACSDLWFEETARRHATRVLAQDASSLATAALLERIDDGDGATRAFALRALLSRAEQLDDERAREVGWGAIALALPWDVAGLAPAALELLKARAADRLAERLAATVLDSDADDANELYWELHGRDEQAYARRERALATWPPAVLAFLAGSSVGEAAVALAAMERADLAEAVAGRAGVDLAFYRPLLEHDHHAVRSFAAAELARSGALEDVIPLVDARQTAAAARILARLQADGQADAVTRAALDLAGSWWDDRERFGVEQVFALDLAGPAVAEALRDWSVESDAIRRARAIRLLAARDDPQTVALARALFEDADDPETIDAAGDALVLRGGLADLDVMLAATRRRPIRPDVLAAIEADTGRLTARLAADQDPAKQRAILDRMFDNGDARARVLAIRETARLDAATRAATVAAWISGRSVEDRVREAALDAIATAIDPARADDESPAARALVGLLLDADDADVREGALLRLRDRIPAVLAASADALLRSDDERVRTAVVEALADRALDGGEPARAARAQIARAARDGSPLVRRRAIEVLGRFGDPAAGRLALDAVADEDARVRLAALNDLAGRLRGGRTVAQPEAITVAAAVVLGKDEDEKCRLAAVGVLAERLKADDAGARAALERARGDDSFAVRAAVGAALRGDRS